MARTRKSFQARSALLDLFSNDKSSSCYCWLRKDRIDSWYSPHDMAGIFVLLIGFSWIAMDLIRTGGWKGCAISAAWCVTYQDPIDQMDGLPSGSWSSRCVAIVASVTAFFLRIQSYQRAWKQRMSKQQQEQQERLEYHSLLLPRHYHQEPKQSQLSNRTTSYCKFRLAVGSLFVSHIAMISCAVIPMSCGCLHDGKEWVYVSWRDYIHDASLWTIYTSTILSAIAAGYHTTTTTTASIGVRDKKQMLLVLTILFAVIQSIGVYKCPTSSDSQRLALLVFEVVAIALSQILHYGTMNLLVFQNSSMSPRDVVDEKKKKKKDPFALLPVY